MTLGNANKILQSIMTPTPVTPTAGNAGLVILNHYLPMLFERLGTTANGHFITPIHQSRSAQYLQYLATGATATKDAILPLNNILSGLPPASAATAVQIPVAEKELLDGLLHAVIGYWPVIGSSSVEGFRGNWLVRKGILIEGDNRWQLTVEKKAYDLLLHQSPFSFSIIKYPWMQKPLHVNWTY